MDTALSSITLDDVFDYIRKEMTVCEDSSDELKECLTGIDEETWHSDMTQYRTRVEELVQKFTKAGVEVHTVEDFYSLGEVAQNSICTHIQTM